MKTVSRYIGMILIGTVLIGGASPAYAKKDGPPAGFEKGEKKGWSAEVPPGWSQGQKKGWGEEALPPGLQTEEPS